MDGNSSSGDFDKEAIGYARPHGLSGRAGFILVASVLTIIGSLFALSPVAQTELPHSETIIPAYAAAYFLNEIVTATLLFSHYHASRQLRILVLAAGYLFAGFMVVPWAITFPHVFDDLGIVTGLQTTAGIAAIRRLAFPAFVIAYATVPVRLTLSGPTWRGVIWVVVGTLALACLVTYAIISEESRLPLLMRDVWNVSANWSYVPASGLLLYGAGAVLLALRSPSKLDLWLIVVLAALALELVLLSYVSGGARLSVGWWAGRGFGLASTFVLLMVMLWEASTLHARLARSLVSERKAREGRVTAMEALSASIAHEIKQPLASMVTNADAGLRWIAKAPPDLNEVRSCLTRIGSDGLRASQLVDGIRTMFMHGSNERTEVDLNGIVREIAELKAQEARLAQVAVTASLEEGVPPVIGNAVQLRSVIANLVDNAIDAVQVSPGPRQIRIATRRQDHDVVVTVEDTGTGIEADDVAKIFEPFYTTKPDGMGMGLMFCRAVIESHGGRLSVANLVPRGCIFSVVLSAAAWQEDWSGAAT